jgi:hypothetical protein
MQVRRRVPLIGRCFGAAAERHSLPPSQMPLRLTCV